MAIPLLLKLLTAHLAGDYLFQTARIAAGKTRPSLLLAHGAVHGVMLLAVGLTEPPSASLWLALPALLVAHVGIDAWTSRLQPRDLRTLALDQTLHLATLFGAVALARPGEPGALAEASGAWLASPEVWVVLVGALIAVPAGATVIGRWVQPFRDALSHESREQRTGLELAGRWIGMFERLLVFVAVLARVESLIGFVIAAKAVLRLPEAREKWSRELAEYYLVGSLASLAWALVTALAVRGWLAG